jgi:hypothetical protein
VIWRGWLRRSHERVQVVDDLLRHQPGDTVGMGLCHPTGDEAAGRVSPTRVARLIPTPSRKATISAAKSSMV